MIKTLTKIFAFTAVTKSLLETKKSQSAGTTQIHPSKIPGRTVFIREKEYFIRENIIDGTTPIIFLHSWGSDSLGSWFKVFRSRSICFRLSPLWNRPSLWGNRVNSTHCNTRFPNGK